MKTKSFEINLTSNCNFNCKYCIVKNRIDESLPPNRDILKRYNNLIKHMKDNYYKDNYLVVKFFGGEPLLYTDEIVAMTPLFLKNVDLVTVTTNGSLVEKNIDKLSKLKLIADKVEFAVSFDFISQKENRNSETYNDCLNGLKWLYENNFCDTVLTVITPKNIEEIDKIFLEFIKFKKDLPKLKLRYSLDKTVEFDTINFDKTESALANIRDFIINYPEYKRSFKMNGSCGSMSNIDRDCFFGNAVMSVDAGDGSLYPGYNFKSQPKHISDMLYIGNINDEFANIVESRNTLINKIDRKVNDKCIGCNATCCFFPWYGDIITKIEDYNRMPSESHCKIHKLIAEYFPCNI